MAAAVLRRVRVERRLEGGKAIGGAGSHYGEGADAAGSVFSAESAPCEVLDVGEAFWATLVAAAGAVGGRKKIIHGRDGNRRW